MARDSRWKIQVELSPLPRAFEIKRAGSNRRLRLIDRLSRLDCQIRHVWNDEPGIICRLSRTRVNGGGSQYEGSEGRLPRASHGPVNRILLPADQRCHVIELGSEGDRADREGFDGLSELFQVEFEAGDAAFKFDRLRKLWCRRRDATDRDATPGRHEAES
jgi:hypothetical protein